MVERYVSEELSSGELERKVNWAKRWIFILIPLMISALVVLMVVVYLGLAARVGCAESTVRIRRAIDHIDVFDLADPFESATLEGARRAFDSLSYQERLSQMRLEYHQEGRLDELFRSARNGSVGGIIDLHDLDAIRTIKSAVTTYGVPPVLFATTLSHGYATIFPSPMGLAATFDPVLVYDIARVIAWEAKTAGYHMGIGPTAAISRDPRWSGTSLSFGEDSHLASEMASSMVRGYEREGLAACVTFFGAPSAVRGGRDFGEAALHMNEFYFDYLNPFRNALSYASAVMVAIHTHGGRALHASHDILTDLLRGVWGWRGVVISAPRAVDALLRRGIHAQKEDAVVGSVYAGIDVFTADDAITVHGEAIANTITEDGHRIADHVNLAAKRVVKLKHNLGIVGDEFANNRAAIGPNRIGSELDIQATAEAYEDNAERAFVQRIICDESALDLAQIAAERSMVLIKNDNNVLPLRHGGWILAGGESADSPVDQLGPQSVMGLQSIGLGGCADHIVTYVTALDDGGTTSAQHPLRSALNRVKENEPELGVRYYRGLAQRGGPKNLTDADLDKRMDDELSYLAEGTRPQLLLLFVGETAELAATTRAFLELSDDDKRMARRMIKLKDDYDPPVPLVMVVCASRPLLMESEFEGADAVIWAWHSGTRGGLAFRRILLGHTSPAGRMPMSVIRHVGQIPTHYASGYRSADLDPDGRPVYADASDEPLIDFGWGLSYGEFEIFEAESSDLVWNSKSARPFIISVNIRKNYQWAADVVLQLYMRKCASDIVAPVKRLKHFERIRFAAEESTRSTFIMLGEPQDFGVYNDYLEWVIEPGVYEISMGFDSQNPIQELNVTVT